MRASSLCSGPQGPDGIEQVAGRRGGRRQVIDAVEPPGQFGRVDHASLDEGGAFGRAQRTGTRQIVQHHDLETLRQQARRQGSSQESRPAGNERSGHRPMPS